MKQFFALIIAVFLCSTPAIAAPPSAWQLSYDAGYHDALGRFAGGSEIMHLVAHRGKLFATNGYWMDSHWVIPPHQEKQSAQVLRLDQPNAQWQVDLELGQTNGYDLRYMKGNILKSVTFTSDGLGNKLSEPVELLVMAAGATMERGGAVSAWVRNDQDGTWHHQIVRHGANTGGIRWVPRDMEIYRDKVTGIERLILLLGNPGVVSGVYDPSLPGKIRWENVLEYPFPDLGAVKTRPLGVVQANGSLLFSVDDAILRRNDGPRPTYTEIVRLTDDVDTDVGGIRGLTTIKNPNGPGDSILFLWAPGGRSTSLVKRLDPDGRGGYTIHDEANMMDLMSQELDVKVTYTLGAHNMMYPVTDPETGETVHVIGFQGNLNGKEELRWPGSRLYAGAMYAIRAADGSYSVCEVNNRYQKGKNILVSPRAFCLSPFGDDMVYVGGHDASNRISDNMAWICRAPLKTVLGQQRSDDMPQTRRSETVNARLQAGPIYELRIYQANERRMQDLVTRFRQHTDGLFKHHGLQPMVYWTASGGTPRQNRRFIYVLKHPSRYAAFANWTHFTNDRQWQRVLETPQFQGLLSGRPVSYFALPPDDARLEEVLSRKQGGIHELRIYQAANGDAQKLKQFYRETMQPALEQHQISTLTTWTPFDRPESEHLLITILHHQDAETVTANWRAVNNDPTWQSASKDNELLESVLHPRQSIMLDTTDLSPIPSLNPNRP